MKPVSGGSPPRDKRIRGVMDVRAGAFAQEVARVLIFVELLSFSMRNVEDVMAM